MLKQARPTGRCWCGCGQKIGTGSFFAQGHDAKALGYLKELHIKGQYANDSTANLLLRFGYGDHHGSGNCKSLYEEYNRKQQRNPTRMSIDTTFLRRCIASLERALEEIEQHGANDDVMYDIYRAACVKQFELVLEQSGKLLRKRLADYFASNRQADRLNFKDLFRHAARHDLIDTETAERWFRYRANRNDTAHDYGEKFAEATLALLPEFIDDAKALSSAVEGGADG